MTHLGLFSLLANWMLVNLTQLDFKGVYMIWLVPSGFQKVLEETNMIQLGEERHMDPLMCGQGQG